MKVNKVLNNNLFLLKICLKIAPAYVFLFCINVLKNSLVSYLEFTIGLNYVLECAEFKKDFKNVLFYMIFLVCFISAGMVFGAWLNEKYRMRKLPYIKAYLKTLLYDHAKSVDIKEYDDSHYYNNLNFVIEESDTQIDRLFVLIEKIISSMATFILTGAFFAVKDYVSLLFMFVIFGGSFWGNKALSKLNYRISIERNPLEKERNYLNRTFYLADYAKEMRLSGDLFSYLAEKYRRVNDAICSIDKRNAHKRFLYDFLNGYVCNTLIHSTLYMFFLVYRAAILKLISYSNIVVLFRSASIMRNSMLNFASIYPYAMESSLYVEKIKNFLNTNSEIDTSGTKAFPEIVESIEFRNVYFSYNGDEKYILNNVSFKMERNKKYALVGKNGAGKTTIIKLLMRMYDATKGEILLNGKNVKEYDLQEYRTQIGVVFQDFCLYAVSLAENVVMGFCEKNAEAKVIDALKKGGFQKRLKGLPLGINTQVTTEFCDDGVDFSGGEAQKIAISRLFYGDRPIWILDEPSSALDPISEYMFNQTISNSNYIKNKMTIFISHRMSTTRFTDKIYVLDKGEICEQGTHDELLSKHGLYSNMWQHQAQLYAEEKTYVEE